MTDFTALRERDLRRDVARLEIMLWNLKKEIRTINPPLPLLAINLKCNQVFFL